MIKLKYSKLVLSWLDIEKEIDGIRIKKMKIKNLIFFSQYAFIIAVLSLKYHHYENTYLDNSAMHSIEFVFAQA